MLWFIFHKNSEIMTKSAKDYSRNPFESHPPIFRTITFHSLPAASRNPPCNQRTKLKDYYQAPTTSPPSLVPTNTGSECQPMWADFRTDQQPDKNNYPLTLLCRYRFSSRTVIEGNPIAVDTNGHPSWSRFPWCVCARFPLFAGNLRK